MEGPTILLRRRRLAMATHCTGVGPIKAKVIVHDVDDQGGTFETDAQIVAFTWDDEAPTTPTGYWYIGTDFKQALTWIAAEEMST
jgi:hypothetical protein